MMLIDKVYEKHKDLLNNDKKANIFNIGMIILLTIVPIITIMLSVFAFMTMSVDVNINFVIIMCSNFFVLNLWLCFLYSELCKTHDIFIKDYRKNRDNRKNVKVNKK